MYKNLSSKSTCLIVFLLFAVFTGLNAQSFSHNSQTNIPDNGTVSVPVVVSGLSSTIDTTNFGLEAVSVNITHADDKQLTLKLQSPDGKIILLAQKNLGVNYNTTFDAVADTFVDIHFPKEGYIYKGNYSGNYRPRMDLALLNNNQDPNGTWSLIVTDDKIKKTGKVNNVTLVFSNQPAKYLFTSSNLPIFKVYTNGQEIIDDPKIVADMFIINNGPGMENFVNQNTYEYQGKIGIEIRGNSSQTLPKLQYGFETRDASGLNSFTTSLLGFPPQSDWIFSAVMTDKSLMRNVLTYELAREMGWWASRTKYCELIINDEYRGVFIFEEKIKKDVNRVNIEKTADLTYPNITGGYIYSLDNFDPGAVTWQTKIKPKFKAFQFVYPKAEDVQPAQLTYLQSYVDSFEAALNGPNFQDPDIGFRKFANDSSFIDYFIIQEMGKNLDGYRNSTYFHKRRLGKIVAMPVWDYDRAWRNDGHCQMDETSGYSYLQTDGCSGDGQGGRRIPWYWKRFRQDTKWESDMICRYNTLRTTTLSEANLFHIIDSSAEVLNAGGQQRNFRRWNILGKYIDNNPYPLQPTFAAEVSTMKNWIADRLAWLDNDLGGCSPAPVAKTANSNNIITVKGAGFNSVYPSPFKDHFIVNITLQKNQNLNIRLVDVNGRAVYQKGLSLLKGTHSIQVNSPAGLRAGLYFLQISGQNIYLNKKLMKQ